MELEQLVNPPLPNQALLREGIARGDKMNESTGIIIGNDSQTRIFIWRQLKRLTAYPAMPQSIDRDGWRYSFYEEYSPREGMKIPYMRTEKI